MRDPKDIVINGKQLSKILEAHKKWLMDEKGGERADLQYANLRYADLRSADLRYADLRYADLRYADLQYADLQYANLQSANLQYANLRYADLRSADLRSADLRYADLRYTENNEFAAALVTITPEGDLIGWKKLQGGLIAKLLIPAKAKRSNATGRKCRAEFAKVLEIWNGDKAVKTGNSQHDPKFVYTVGKTVKPDKWSDDRWEECDGGIHFFITKIEAMNY